MELDNTGRPTLWYGKEHKEVVIKRIVSCAFQASAL